MKLTKNMSSDFDEFLEEEHLFANAEANAIKRVIAFEIEQAMKEKSITKTKMAENMNTSRASLNRLLDPSNNSVTLATIESAAAALGKKLQFQLV